MNSKFLNAAGWTAEVAKMVNVFGAPINDADAKVSAITSRQTMGCRQPSDAGP
jgi:hypothetical protein